MRNIDDKCYWKGTKHRADNIIMVNDKYCFKCNGYKKVCENYIARKHIQIDGKYIWNLLKEYQN